MDSHRPPGARAPLGADLVIPAIALAFAVYFFFSISDLAWEAKANGVLIGSLLVFLILVQIVRIALEFARGRASLRMDTLLAPRAAGLQRLGMVALTIGFIAAIEWMGLTLALFVAMAIGLHIMGERRPRRIAGVSAAVAGTVYLLFIALLNADFPHGPVENLLSALVARQP